MHKFKVGDIVIGNNAAKPYAITKPGTICQVTKVYEGENLIAVRVLHQHQSFIVIPCAFDLIESVETSQNDVLTEQSTEDWNAIMEG
jgi:hypothetical protein